MNALERRDALFSEIHKAALKPRGHFKKGHWSIRSEAPFHWTVHVHASQYSDRSRTGFSLEALIFHEGWYSLTQDRPFPGVTDTSYAIGENLGEHCAPSLKRIEVLDDTDVAPLLSALIGAVEQFALPLFAQCSSLPGMLAYYEQRPDLPQVAHAAAGVCLLMKRDEDAMRYMQMAKAAAPNDKARAWLQMKQRAMWSKSVTA